MTVQFVDACSEQSTRLQCSVFCSVLPAFLLVAQPMIDVQLYPPEKLKLY